MNINLIHLDDALLGQSQFMRNCERLGAVNLDIRDAGPDARLWSSVETTKKLHGKLQGLCNRPGKSGPVVNWLGSGDFHHVSALLIEQVSQAQSKNTTVIHFDNHPDWVRFKSGIHCGSWVSYVLKTDQVQKVVSLGICSPDLTWPEFKSADLQYLAAARLIAFPLEPPRTFVFRRYGDGPAHTQRGHSINWSSMDQQLTGDGLHCVLKQIENTPIYITIDKDVLSSSDAITNWDQGKLGLDDLLGWLRALMLHCDVAGIDIVGDHSPVVFGGSMIDRMMKRGEVWLDQPRKRVCADTAAKVNETTNLAILSVLEACL